MALKLCLNSPPRNTIWLLLLSPASSGNANRQLYLTSKVSLTSCHAC